MNPMYISRALESIKTWHFFLFAVLFSEIFTIFLNSFQSMFRWGRISRELVEIGAIDAIFVSLLVTFILLPIIRHSGKLTLEKKTLQKEIIVRKQAEERLQQVYDELDIRVRERTANLAKANELLMDEIIERERTEEMLQQLSERDPLTMIYNRRKLFELLRTEVAKAKRHARPLTIIMLDIDHFKKVSVPMKNLSSCQR